MSTLIRGALLAAAIAGAAVMAPGCSSTTTSPGGLLVVMSSDGTLTQATRLHVDITSSDGSKPYRNADYAIPAETTLPTTIGVETDGDSATAVSVNASLWAGTTLLDDREDQVIQIPTARVVELDIVFSAKCTAHADYQDAGAASPCGTGQTCNAADGTCVSSTVNAGQLPDYSGGDAGTGTPDATVVDSGADGATPDSGPSACSPSTCPTGCCDAAGTCVTQTSKTQCGNAGVVCAACTGTNECVAGACGCASSNDCPTGTACDTTTQRCTSSCTGNLVCQDSCCDGTVCQSVKATRCIGSTPQTCEDPGTWVTGPIAGGTCGAVCTPGVPSCNGQQPQTCDATGTLQDNGGPCSGKTCVSGVCSGVCAPGMTQCCTDLCQAGGPTCGAETMYTSQEGCTGNTSLYLYPESCGPDGEWVKGSQCPLTYYDNTNAFVCLYANGAAACKPPG